MTRRSNRPRRTASPRKIKLLRVAGWRYSASREAWVHRVGKGRRGPVFIDASLESTSATSDGELAAAIVAARRDERATARGPLRPLETLDPTPETGARLLEPASPPASSTLARRVPGRTARQAAPRPTPSPREVEVALGGELVKVRVDGRPPPPPGRPHLIIAADEATA